MIALFIRQDVTQLCARFHFLSLQYCVRYHTSFFIEPLFFKFLFWGCLRAYIAEGKHEEYHTHFHLVSLGPLRGKNILPLDVAVYKPYDGFVIIQIEKGIPVSRKCPLFLDKVSLIRRI